MFQENLLVHNTTKVNDMTHDRDYTRADELVEEGLGAISNSQYGDFLTENVECARNRLSMPVRGS